MNLKSKRKIGILTYPFDLFAIASISIIIFLLIELVSRIYNLYLVFPPIDIITHFAAGGAMTYVAFFAATLLKDKYRKRLSFLFAFIGAIAWEVVETLEEMIVFNPPHLRDIFFWDGFFDIIFTLVGSLVALLLLKHVRPYFSKKMLIKYLDRFE